MGDFLSGKVKKTAPANVAANRYKFLKLEDAEPDLGVAPANNSILTSNAVGSRYWSTLGSGLAVANSSIFVAESSVPIDTNLFDNSAGNTLSTVLKDLDTAISNNTTVTDNAIVSVDTDDTLTGNGKSATPLSVVKWAEPITITLSGDASGSVSIDGSNNVTLTVASMTPSVGEIITLTKTFTLTQEWSDVGISGTNLQTGTYMVQLFANDIAAGGSNNNEYYSGTMSWYSGATTPSLELASDEIVLHRAGGGSDAGLYLRTLRANVLKLQIYSNLENASAANYVFKFRKMI
jgi:hypothetical protein